MLTAVVPYEMPFVYAERKAIVENAFHILGFDFVFVHAVGIEESRRRQLFGVAYDYRRLRPCERAYRFGGGHLRGFVEDYRIEKSAFRP